MENINESAPTFESGREQERQSLEEQLRIKTAELDNVINDPNHAQAAKDSLIRTIEEEIATIQQKIGKLLFPTGDNQGNPDGSIDIDTPSTTTNDPWGDSAAAVPGDMKHRP